MLRHAGGGRFSHLGRWLARFRTWVREPARSGDAAAISGYLGTGDRFDGAVADFAEAYADQTEADHAAFVRAGEGLTAPGAGRSAATNQRKGAEG